MHWFKSRKETTQTILILLMVVALSCGIAVAASLLWDTAHSNTTLSKEHFLTIQLTGSSATDSIKPGESVALSPAITNNGDVGAGVFLKVTIPAAGSSPAYVFEPSSAWSMLDGKVEGTSCTQIWYYGTSSLLETLSPGSSTDTLTSSFTMEPTITGSQFADMNSVDIGFDGYLVDYECFGTDPETAWYMIPGNE